MSSDSDAADAAATLRRLLAAVERQDLTADGPAAAGLVRRLGGAAAALELVSAADVEGVPDS